MTDKQRPEALRLADALDYCDASVALQAAAELRRLHAENETLRTGYAAARLEIESLNAQLHAAKQINAAQFWLLAASIPGSALRASHGQAPQQEPSYTSAQLAEMVLSDCGHSSNYTPLLNRVAARIDAHVERCLESKKTTKQEAQEPAAWMTQEGDRVVTEKTMNAARRGGGAMLTSLHSYSVALVRAAAQEGKKAMADTTSLAPTDYELIELGHECELDAVVFGRAVLAKWGAPATVGVEPIGYLYCGGSYGDELADWEIVADQLQCDKLNEHHGSLGKEAKLPIYTTTQPNHAQPVACEPLIRQMRNALSLPCDRWNATQSRIVREAIDAADAWLEGN